MKPAVFPRLLVMGCSRSGTTLLQGLLANHFRIFTFPETGVFLKAFGMRGVVLPWVHLGLTLGKERKALQALSRSLPGGPGRVPYPPLPGRSHFVGRSINGVVAYFDALASAHGKDIWLEKTPRHVLHARRIRRAIPDSLCIHMVRNGPDVVASIVDRANRYPERFPRQCDASYGIRQWNRSVRATTQALTGPGHAVVFYDRLVSETETTLRRLCEIIGIDFEDGMDVPVDSPAFIHPEESWKAQVSGPVRPAASKFDRLFDAETRAQILRALEVEEFEKLKYAASASQGGVFFSGTGA